MAINRVIAESAPILITMGTSVLFPKQGVLSSGRTLSSHVYLVGMNSVTNSEGIVYQTAFLTLLFLMLLNLFVYFFQQKRMSKGGGI